MGAPVLGNVVRERKLSNYLVVLVLGLECAVGKDLAIQEPYTTLGRVLSGLCGKGRVKLIEVIWKCRRVTKYAIIDLVDPDKAHADFSNQAEWWKSLALIKVLGSAVLLRFNGNGML